MMRLILVIVGLLLGLGAVAVSEGRMAHLRKVAPSALPGWAANLTGSSGLMRGEAQGLLLPGLPVPAQVSWDFDRLNMQGLLWRIVLTAEGFEGGGKLGVPARIGAASLTNGEAVLTLDQLPQIAGTVRATGVLKVENIQATFRYPSGDITGLQAQAQWLGAQIDEYDIGVGALSLVSDSNGGWRAPFEITGDVVAVNGMLRGRFDQSEVKLEVTIDDAGAMPDDWKQALDQQASRGENGWSLTRDLDLAQGWPVF